MEMVQMITDLLILWGVLAFLGLSVAGVCWLAVDTSACRCQRTRSNHLIRNPKCPKHTESAYPSRTTYPWE